MKKSTVFMAIAFAALAFAGCSQEELGTADSSVESQNVSGDVAISIGSTGGNLYSVTVKESSARTRGSITGDNETEVNVIPNMGVFCLAREVQGTNPEATPIKDITNWLENTFADGTKDKDDVANDNHMYCLMNNVLSTRTTSEIKAKSGKAYKVDWDGVYYYPTTLFYNYDFYAYYPWTSVTCSGRKAVVPVDVDGKTDVLWGRATVTDDMTDWEKKYAFSAKYFREPDSVAITTNPVIQLQHALTRFRFFITPGTTVDGGNDISEAKDMTVEKIAIKNVSIHQNLTVADLDNLGLQLDSRMAARDTEKGNLVLYEPEDVKDTIATLAFPDDVTMKDTLRVGDCLMVYPAKSFQIQVVLSKIEEREKQVTDTISKEWDEQLQEWHYITETRTVKYNEKVKYVSEAPLVMANGGQLFAAGKSYDIVVTVHGPKQIGVGAFLKEWEDTKGPSFEM